MAFEVRSGGIRVETEWSGAAIDEVVRLGAACGLGLGADTCAVSVHRAPLETATLRDSATASHEAESLTAAVSYGRPMREAARRTQPPPPHRRAKILRNRTCRRARHCRRLVQAQIKKSLLQGSTRGLLVIFGARLSIIMMPHYPPRALAHSKREL
jgi:hypothetical protein